MTRLVPPPTARATRYAVERDGKDYWIRGDDSSIPCAPYRARIDAERECARLNAAPVDTASATPKRQRKKKRKHVRAKGELLSIPSDEPESVSPERSIALAAAFTGTSATDMIAKRAAEAASKREAAQSYRDWLPAMLRAWADEIALKHGADRRSWRTPLVHKMLDADTFLNAFGNEKDEITIYVCPSDATRHLYTEYGDGVIEACELLSVHYLAGADTVEVKAGHFGLRPSAYWERLRAAHRMIAAEMHEMRPPQSQNPTNSAV